jgi:hypothetical protein
MVLLVLLQEELSQSCDLASHLAMILCKIEKGLEKIIQGGWAGPIYNIWK